jgi:hypothetical protein
VLLVLSQRQLFQGVRGGPLSESLYGRIWHQARAAAIGQAGTQPTRPPSTFAMPRRGYG